MVRPPLLCPAPVCQVRRSWDRHEITHSRPDRLHHDSVRLHAAQWERRREPHRRVGGRKDHHGDGKRMGAEDFFIGGDVNIELKLEGGNEKLEGLDSFDLRGLHGPECRGGGEDVVTHQKIRWLQSLRDFEWAVSSTWASCDALGNSHTTGMGFARQENQLTMLWGRVISSPRRGT